MKPKVFNSKSELVEYAIDMAIRWELSMLDSLNLRETPVNGDVQDKMAYQKSVIEELRDYRNQRFDN